MTGISDINFWSLTCGSHCSLWNLLGHLCLQDRSSSMLVTFHLSPDMFPKLSTPTEASQSSSLGFPTFPSPHHLPPVSPLSPDSQDPPTAIPSSRAEPPSQDPPVLLLGAGEGKCDIKAIPLPHLFSTLGGSSLSTHSFFCSFPPFFPWHCRKCHGTAGRASGIMRNEWFSKEFLGAEPSCSQTWQCHP